ncbi:MAG: DUF5666 domain-containing protein [Chloroflexi bacterium]|jgi:hypothetical protein|nr:DUF5666 domain-containing protein [Chloroflexota bacterium]
MSISTSLRRAVPALAVSGLAIGAIALAVAIGSGGSTAPAAADTTAAVPIAAVDTGWVAPTGNDGAGAANHGRGGMGDRMGGRGPMGDITITAINGNTLSLKTVDGWTRTIDATGATITKGGQTIAVSGLAVGDQVAFQQTKQTDGSYKITAIAVVLPHVSGTVTATDSSSITVALRDGTTKKILVTSSTTYTVGTADATKTAVVVGVRISAEGTLAADGTLTAATVKVSPAMVAGTVATKASDSFTLTTRDGSTVTVKVTSATTYQAAGVTSPTLANVTVGAAVAAQGTRTSDGSLTATVVRIGVGGGRGWDGDEWGGMMGPGMMDGGRGMGRGFGPGGQWDDDQNVAPSASPSTDTQGG